MISLKPAFFECILFTFHHAAVSVVVRSEGNAQTGETLDLNCFVTRDESITTSPTIVWLGIDGQSLSNGTGTRLFPLVVNGTVITSVLQFSPLSESHEGNYTCQASVNSTDIEYTFILTVESKSVSLNTYRVS